MKSYGLATVLLFAATTASAGRVYIPPIVSNSDTGIASGSVLAARMSATTDDMVGCRTHSEFTTGSSRVTQCQVAAPSVGMFCTASNPRLLRTANALSQEGYLEFRWPAHVEDSCTRITVGISSLYTSPVSYPLDSRYPRPRAVTIRDYSPFRTAAGSFLHARMAPDNFQYIQCRIHADISTARYASCAAYGYIQLDDEDGSIPGTLATRSCVTTDEPTIALIETLNPGSFIEFSSGDCKDFFRVSQGSSARIHDGWF